jgi:hypothetical protein
MAKTVKSFRNYNFENCDVDPKYYGDFPHANFFKGEFLPIARREFKNLAKKLGAELTFRGNYFEYSAFFKKSDKCIYVHIGDVRYNIGGNWYDKVLYRTAKDEKDYSGGANYYCSYDKLESEMNDLFDRM